MPCARGTRFILSVIAPAVFLAFLVIQFTFNNIENEAQPFKRLAANETHKYLVSKSVVHDVSSEPRPKLVFVAGAEGTGHHGLCSFLNEFSLLDEKEGRSYVFPTF